MYNKDTLPDFLEFVDYHEIRMIELLAVGDTRLEDKAHANFPPSKTITRVRKFDENNKLIRINEYFSTAKSSKRVKHGTQISFIPLINKIFIKTFDMGTLTNISLAAETLLTEKNENSPLVNEEDYINGSIF